ncbi:MAG: hypothetical protein RIC55_23950 [Pirellulaceae bacterium]
MSFAEEMDLELRISWGGGQARRWEGSIAVEGGGLSSPTALGLEADEPGSIFLEDGQVRVRSRSGRTYDGVDVLVRGPADARLVVSLHPAGEPELARRLDVDLGRLIANSSGAVLDSLGNRLSVRRSPGDRMRVDFKRDRMVFAPGERFEVEVTPHLYSVQPNATVNLELRLLEGRSDREVWKQEHPIRADEAGALPVAAPVTVELPEKEGVYDLLISIVPWHLPAPFVRTRPLLQRKVQLVCIAERPPPRDAVEWREQLELDPANPSRWERWKQLPQFKLIPGFGHGAFGNRAAGKRMHAGRTWLELAVDNWQAFPLPAAGVGKPHIVEIEVPRDMEQTMGVSIVEPDASGKVMPIGLDSGIHQADVQFEMRDGVGVHRLVFWPRTASPLLLLVNKRTDRPALFGTIRLLAGPDRLPSSAIDTSIADPRLLAAYYDKPLFPENFSSDEAVDEATGRGLDDWATYYRGAERLTEYLNYVGYNAAAISIACEGSAIYPSRLLQPTPKYDTGVYFGTAQDPMRKDVAEMLFRLFDREGLVLIPAVQFAGPLPKLERLLREQPDSAEGVQLVNFAGVPYTAANGTKRGMAPYYNPLDERVQEAMLEVIDEIIERYGHHRSFGGIALGMGPQTYAQLPGDLWGLDARTVARFSRDTGLAPPGLDAEGEARRRFFLTEGRMLWLQWRAEQLTKLHVRMQERIGRQRREAKLYLAATDTLNEGEAARHLRPALPPRGSLSDALLSAGLLPALYHDKPGLVLLRPREVGPLLDAAAEVNDRELAWREQLNRSFQSAETGSVFYHRPLMGRLTSFETVSPFGAENTHLYQVTHAVPEGAANRARFAAAVAQLDATSLFDGGWMLGLGQDDALQPLFDVYRRLPAQSFTTATPKTVASADGPVVVRSLSRGGRTYVYAVNDSPWKLIVRLQVKSPPDALLEQLGGREQAAPTRTVDQWRWSIVMEPYDLVGALVTSDAVEVVDWQVELVDGKRIAESLARRLEDVRARAGALRSRNPLKVPRNADFELPPDRDLVPGWLFARDVGVEAGADGKQHHKGQQSLHLKSTGGVAWARSAPFEPPKTGRISVWVWLKTADADRQPPLRLAIEGRLDGKVYYKYAHVGAGSGAPRLGDHWADYLFHIDDLPIEGLTDLRVGFDLMGPGEVWIDDVQVFDLWFYDNERDELLKSVALADLQLGKGRLNDCRKFLESYWPRYLMRHVSRPAPSMPATATLKSRPTADSPSGSGPGAPEDKPTERTAQQPTMFQRFRNLLPSRLLPF